jgi:hypothetical protein
VEKLSSFDVRRGALQSIRPRGIPASRIGCLSCESDLLRLTINCMSSPAVPAQVPSVPLPELVYETGTRRASVSFPDKDKDKVK